MRAGHASCTRACELPQVQARRAQSKVIMKCYLTGAMCLDRFFLRLLQIPLAPLSHVRRFRAPATGSLAIRYACVEFTNA